MAKIVNVAAVLITSYLVSVRENETGSNVRAFVYLGGENKVLEIASSYKS